MTEEAIKKLDQQLNCSICLDTYTDPKVLQCFHTYCTKCIIPLVVRDRQGQLTLTCPNCRHVTPIPPNGVRGLQSAFRINELLEIRDDLKKAQESIPSQEPGATSQTPICSEHAGRELELFCETCNELLCYICVAKGGKHHDHDYDPLDEVFDKYKGEIMSSLEPMVKQLKTIDTALAEIDTRSKEIFDQGVIIEASIHDTIRQLHDILDVWKTELIGQKHCITWRKALKNFAIQMNTIQVKLKGFLGSDNKRLNSAEILKIKNTIKKQIKELTTPSQPDLSKPNTEADVTFLAPPNFTAECKEYVPTSIDPLQSLVTSKGLFKAVVDEKSSVLLQAINYNGEPHDVPTQFIINCVLVSEITHITLNGNVERKGQSQYEISYQPIIKGRHQLHIKVEDQHVRGSPFPVAVKLPLEKLGTPILTIDGVKGPWGITFNQRGDVVVSECAGHCVSIFSPSEDRIRSFGTYGSDQGRFHSPCGVAVDDEGHILVADSRNHCIKKLTNQGQLITSVGTRGIITLQFYLPHAITYNCTNNKVYVVDDNCRVTILNSDLTFSSSFGKKGCNEGQFNKPENITCDNAGNVYVADGDNHRIQVFTADGRFLKMFGRYGHRRGELNHPVSITIDTSDRVYIGDYNHRVSVFTPDGDFITSFCQKKEREREYGPPCGLAVDANGVVFVCDYYNNIIQLY